ncbi:MAG: hypothetical protein K2K75_00865 [Muribaculaceae bacterium]|nr:hypothetical protein [Muribaculaceae bacterium]
MQEQQLERKDAAEEFAGQIRKLAENGHIDTLSMKIYDWNCDDLFRLAKKIGLKELNVTSVFGVSHENNTSGQS